MKEFLKVYILDNLPHLLTKIDIILMASITLMGFMIAALAILKVVIPIHFNESKTLKNDIYNVFFRSIKLLIISTILSIIAFFFNSFELMKYISLIAFIIFLTSLIYVYKSVSIIFLLEKDS